MSKGNLPAEYTSFVGRTGEVAEGLAGLASARLLTVTGPGGVGKTRVATRIAQAARRSFPDGVWYAELSAVHDEEELAGRVAQALGVPGRRTADDVAAVLRDRRALVLLDTCEHLTPAVSRLAEAMLRHSAEARVLVTGRRPPSTGGQRILDLRPLPDADALALFADRAVAADPGFKLTPEVRRAAAAVCRGVDALPLAVELAAACLRTLSVGELRDRIRDRGALSAGATTSVLPRHRDLRALVGWSHELCGAEQRVLWAALSVVRGPFEPEMAESIGAEAGLPEARVLAVLADLVDGSVVSREPTPEGPRYRMLRVYREVGVEHLEDGARKRLTARYGTRRPGPAPRPRPRRVRDPGRPVLSARELQVAVLITEGLTNLEIARRLVISKRTVDAHVRNILAKGHLASRTHVAAWVASSLGSDSIPASVQG